MMVLFTLWYFCDDQCWHASGCPCALLDDYKAAKPEVSTPRQPRESDSCVCAFRLAAPATEVSQQCVSCEEMCNHNMSWSAVECRVLVCRLTRAVDRAPWRRNTTRAVMSWSLVLCIHVRSGHATQTSTPTGSLPVHREQFPPTVLPAARRHTNLTITDCDVMTTWILTSNQKTQTCEQCALNAARFLRLRFRQAAHDLCRNPCRSPPCVSKETSTCHGIRGMWKRSQPQPKC